MNNEPTKPEIMRWQRLRDLLNYDLLEGEFRYRRARKGLHPNVVVSWIDDDGYVILNVEGVGYRAGELAWFWVRGCSPEHRVKHVNGDKADYRFVNLEADYVLPGEPAGVYWDATKQRWQAELNHIGKLVNCGRYSTEAEARYARLRGEAFYWGS